MLACKYYYLIVIDVNSAKVGRNGMSHFGYNKSINLT